MKHYFFNEQIYAFEDDGSQDHLITDEMRPLTKEELAVLRSPIPPSKEERIAALQTAYDTDRKRLNDAWLSAMIAGGEVEAARKAAIMEQMDALDAQLEIDILTILMEE